MISPACLTDGSVVVQKGRVSLQSRSNALPFATSDSQSTG